MVWPSKCSHESLTNVDHSEGNPRLARRARSVKAEPVARLECFAEASIASIGAGKRCDSATGAEDIRCGGRYFGKCSDDMFPDSELPVHLGTPLPGRYQRMKAWPISPRVNSPTNNDPEIMAPLGA
jgi:hypothetical protein